MEEELGRRALAKVTRRLIPFLFGIYVVAYLDRVNVSFAQLQLEDDLDFSDTIFGLGAGIFSLGYVIFGVPSNLALATLRRAPLACGDHDRLGHPLGVDDVHQRRRASFYVLRFLLGAAEAGFFPGIILYLTWWFPERERTRALALFLTAISVAYVAGGPLSGGLLELDGFLGLDGWQWLFLCEGLPAVVLGFFTLRYLDERPGGGRVARAGRARLPRTRVARERALMEAAPGRRQRRRGARQRAGLAARPHLLHPAGGRLRPHLLRAGPGAGPHRLQRLRGGRARGAPFGIATVAMLVVARRAD